MHFSDEEHAKLKAWLTPQLRMLSEADPTVLANYVVALLKKEKSVDELRPLCEDQLREFLKHETKPFVRKLFDLLSNEAWMADLERNEQRGHRKRRLSEDESSRRHEEESYRHRSREHDREHRRDSKRPRSPRKCRDFYEKGYCLLGDSCPDQHGPEKVVVDEQGLNHFKSTGIVPRMTVPSSPTSPFYHVRPSPRPVPRGPQGRGRGAPQPPIPLPLAAMLLAVGRGRGVVPKPVEDGGRGRGRGRGSDQPFKRTPRQRSSTLCACNIPPNLNNIGKLDEHFRNYGQVVNIEVKRKERKAYIQFASPQQASAAKTSPDAVMGNRFVKVYYVDEEPSEEEKEKEEKMNEEEKEEKEEEKEEEKKDAAQQVGIGVEFVERARQAAEALKVEKEKQKEMRGVLDEIQKKKQELIHEQMAQQRVLVERLRKLKEEGKQDTPEHAQIVATFKQVSEAIQATLHKDIAMMQAHNPDIVERKRKMLDTELGTTDKPIESVKGVMSGRGRGHRGRGRGRGRGGRLHLDLRTTTLSVTGENDVEILRGHFEGFGPIKEMRESGDGVVVEFVARRAAENAKKLGGQCKGRELKLEWVEREKGEEKSEEKGEEEDVRGEEGSDGEDEVALKRR